MIFRRILFALPLFFCFSGVFSSSAKAAPYAVAERPTPVLNTPDFRVPFGGRDGRTLNLDRSGLIREVEFIALPGTVFEVVDSFRVAEAVILRVVTPDYPAPASGLFIDSRFVKMSSKAPPPRARRLPSMNEILDRMARMEGVRYVWGGNVPGGIPELLQYYPPAGKLTLRETALWTLRGVDCSGLLYEATNGATPRNTSDMIYYGEPVDIQGLSAEAIAARLRPLDLIVWKGHVIIVFDEKHTIESCLSCTPGGGVTFRNLHAVLREIMASRRPVNHYPERGGQKAFVVRRWYP